MAVTERVAYVKGLFDGLDIDTDKKEGKLLLAMLEVIEELAESVANLEDQNAEISTELDDLYDELSALEEDLLDDEDNELDDNPYQVICPTCGEIIYLDSKTLAEGSISCPACGEDLEFDLSDLSDDDLIEGIVSEE